MMMILHTLRSSIPGELAVFITYFVPGSVDEHCWGQQDEPNTASALRGRQTLTQEVGISYGVGIGSKVQAFRTIGAGLSPGAGIRRGALGRLSGRSRTGELEVQAGSEEKGWYSRWGGQRE